MTIHFDPQHLQPNDQVCCVLSYPGNTPIALAFHIVSRINQSTFKVYLLSDPDIPRTKTIQDGPYVDWYLLK